MGSAYLPNQHFFKAAHTLHSVSYDAVEAYKEALGRLQSSYLRGKLLDFVYDHQRHLEEIATLMTELGAEMPQIPEALPAKGKIVVADIFGDTGILMALEAIEEEVLTAYEQVMKDVPSRKARQLLERGLLDERRHCAWIVTMIQKREAQGLMPHPHLYAGKKYMERTVA